MPKKLLIIDDDPDIREMFEDLFGEEGFQVLMADSGELGLEMFESESVDLILCDLIMPGIGGMEVLRKIRKKDQEIPCLMLSGHMTPENFLRCKKAGATDIFEKPIDYQDLLKEVRGRLGR